MINLILMAWFYSVLVFSGYGTYEYFIIHNLSYGPMLGWSVLAFMAQRAAAYFKGAYQC